MLKFIKPLPKGQVYVALSGGVDSVVLAHFLSKTRQVHCLHFNHGTPNAPLFEKFCTEFCAKYELSLTIGNISQEKHKDQSWEEFWRINRYAFLKSFNQTVLTAHNLNDQVENWIWSSLHGNPRLMPYKNGCIERPLIATSKEAIKQYAEYKQLEWIEDPSNQDVEYMRNFIRHELLPKALVVNPGLFKVVYKKMLQDSYT